MPPLPVLYPRRAVWEKKGNAHECSLPAQDLQPLPLNTLEKMESQENVQGQLYTLNYLSLVVGEVLNIVKITTFFF